MAYIQTTKRLIHVQEGLTKLKNRLFQIPTSLGRLDYVDFITVTEIIPEIDILLKRSEFDLRYRSDSIEKKEEFERLWSERKEQYIKQNQINSKGIKILIRVSDIMELHDEKR